MDVTAIVIAIFGGGSLLGLFQFFRDKARHKVETDSILVVGADKALDTMRDAIDVANRQRDDAVADADRLRIQLHERDRVIDELREQLGDVREKLREAQVALLDITEKFERLQRSISPPPE